MKNTQIITSLRATTKRLEKEAIIKEAWDKGNLEFFEGANMTFSGMFVFNVKKIPEKEKNTGKETTTFADFKALAMKLHNRELTGHDARDEIQAVMEKTDKDEWNLFYRLILLKDFKAGASDSTINKILEKEGDKAKPFIIPEYPYQRCCLPKSAKLDEFPWKDGVLSQIKSDGMFVNVNVHDDGIVDILTRAGRAFPQEELQNLLKDIKVAFPKGTATHGEFLVFRNGKELPREIGNGMLNSLSKGGTLDAGLTPVYVVWDQIPLTSAVPDGVCKTPYKERIAPLKKQVAKLSKDSNIHMVVEKTVYSMKEAMEHYVEMLGLGKEGTIIKHPQAEWKDGTSKFQVKLKLEADFEVEIVGFNAGNGKNAKTFGSIITKSSDGLLEVNISGFKDEERVEIWSEHEELIGTIITVRGNSIMKPTSNNGKYSVFLPRFVEFRRDKTKADSLQKIQEQFEAAQEAALNG